MLTGHRTVTAAARPAQSTFSQDASSIPTGAGNYTSYEFAATLNGKNMRQSVGRTGICWDNAMAESFFGALKNEWTNRMTFTTQAQARPEVVKYIEGFYNRRRLHSGLGYKTH